LKNKLVYIGIAVVLIIALAIGLGVYINSNSTKYVAKVDGQKITVAEYKFFLAGIKDNFEQQYNVTTSDAATKKQLWETKIGTDTAEGLAKNSALESAQEFKIQLMKAKDSGIKLDQSDKNSVDTYINKIIQTNNGKAQAATQVKAVYGLTLDELKGVYQEMQIVDKFMAQEKAKIKPTDAEMKNYYDTKMEKAGEFTTVWHVLVSTQDSSNNALPAADQKTKEKLAEDILTKVKSGVNFDSLVQQYSDDPGSMSTAGEYTIGKGQMVAEFENWAFKAKPGDVAIVKTSYGYHVMKKPTYKEELSRTKEKTIDNAYGEILAKWKLDKKYSMTKNLTQYNSISVLQL